MAGHSSSIRNKKQPGEPMVINAVNSVSGHQWFSAVTAYSKELSDFIHYGEGHNVLERRGQGSRPP
jgi:hypothetical protein